VTSRGVREVLFTASLFYSINTASYLHTYHLGRVTILRHSVSLDNSQKRKSLVQRSSHRFGFSLCNQALELGKQEWTLSAKYLFDVEESSLHTLLS
jgi:hypothetical protein